MRSANATTGLCPPTFINLVFSFLLRPDRFLLSDLMDWMHEVMDKDEIDWRYSRSDLRIDFVPFIKGYALEKMPFGQKWLRAATIDKLERVKLT